MHSPAGAPAITTVRFIQEKQVELSVYCNRATFPDRQDTALTSEDRKLNRRPAGWNLSAESGASRNTETIRPFHPFLRTSTGNTIRTNKKTGTFRRVFVGLPTVLLVSRWAVRPISRRRNRYALRAGFTCFASKKYLSGSKDGFQLQRSEPVQQFFPRQ